MLCTSPSLPPSLPPSPSFLPSSLPPSLPSLPPSVPQLLTSYYKISVLTKRPVPDTGTAATPAALIEPLSLSTALSLSMGTSDELNESITGLTGLTGLTGEDASNEEVTVEEVPDNIPVDIKAKVAVSMIQLKYPLPKVHPSLYLFSLSPPSLPLSLFPLPLYLLSLSLSLSLPLYLLFLLPSSSSNAYVFFCYRIYL